MRGQVPQKAVGSAISGRGGSVGGGDTKWVICSRVPYKYSE